MDILNGNLKKLYLKYLGAAFGSALITSIYGIADMAMVGQYHGPIGSSAMGVVSPIWNIIYSFGLMCGIGASVLFSVSRSVKDEKRAMSYFTSSVVLGLIISAILIVLLCTLENQLLYLFACTDELMPLCKEYLLYIKFAVPIFIFTQILAAFLRNDGNPNLATIGVVGGGLFNIVGDYLLIFVCNMGIKGAGIATCLGALISVLIMCIHFFSKKNTLRLCFSKQIFRLFPKIALNGFSSFIIDISMGVLTIFFNNQIMKYFGADELAVYAVIINIGTIIQCCAYGVGQAAQPILSQNYGAGKFIRVKSTLFYSIITCFIFATLWTISIMVFPTSFISFFMKPTDEVLSIAPKILRMYSISFILLPFNIFSTYYFQSVLKPFISTAVSIGRGIVISGILIFLLPLITSEAIWFTMPVTEIIVAVFVVFMMVKGLKEHKENTQGETLKN